MLASIFIFIISYFVIFIYSKVFKKDFKFKNTTALISLIIFIILFSIAYYFARTRWDATPIKEYMDIFGILYVLILTLLGFGISCTLYSILLYVLFEKYSIKYVINFIPLILCTSYLLIVTIEALNGLSPAKLAFLVFNPWAIFFKP